LGDLASQIGGCLAASRVATVHVGMLMAMSFFAWADRPVVWEPGPSGRNGWTPAARAILTSIAAKVRPLRDAPQPHG
jgi:hypothetical protein